MDLGMMAWRNVWRNPRRTLVTMGAMTLALWVMILYAGLVEGYLRDMERNILDLEVGDVQVFAGDYRLNPSIYTRIENPGALLQPLEEAGFAASARLLAWGMAAADESAAGVSFRGVDVARDARVSEVHAEVERGRWLDPNDPRGVVLGRRLARILGAETGTELVVLTQGYDGAMAYDLYTVRGVLRGIGDATDRTGVFMTEGAFRALLGIPDGAHQIIVRRPEGIDLSSATQRIREIAPSYDIESWRDLLPTLASLMDSARGMMIIMFFIVYVAIGILILNAMLMAVFERVREFGVLKAIGVGPVQVLALIVVESAIQAALAVALGVGLAVPAILYLSETGIDLGTIAGTSVMGIALDPIWRAAITPHVFLVPIAVLVAIVAAAVLYPALKAAWIQPVEAMHHH